MSLWNEYPAVFDEQVSIERIQKGAPVLWGCIAG
jgi:hypothetical protein